MGRKSAKLKNKEKAVIALFKYIKQQSGKTQIYLEKKLCISENAPSETIEMGWMGKQWSRWSIGEVLPEINLVKKLYEFAVKNLIDGAWKENGNEAEWAELLPAVIKSELSFLVNHRPALTISYRSLSEFHAFITPEMIRGIEVGYYIPPAEDIDKVFFMNVLNTHYNALTRIDRFITLDSDDDTKLVDVLLFDLDANFGINKQDDVFYKFLAEQWGLSASNTNIPDLLDQLLLKMSDYADSLEEMADRMISLSGGVLGAEDSKIGDQIRVSAISMRKRVDELSGSADKKAGWRSDLLFLISKCKDLDGTLELKYISVAPMPEKDRGGRSYRDLRPELFALNT